MIYHCPRCSGWVTYDRRLRFEAIRYCINCGWCDVAPMDTDDARREVGRRGGFRARRLPRMLIAGREEML